MTLIVLANIAIAITASVALLSKPPITNDDTAYQATRVQSDQTKDGDRAGNDIYSGETWDGRPNGRGEMKYWQGDRYEGYFANGVPHGKGVLVTAEGDRFEGEFWMGKWHGRGVLTTAEGQRYEGTWEHGREVSVTLVPMPQRTADRLPGIHIPQAQTPIQPARDGTTPRHNGWQALEGEIKALPRQTVMSLQARLNQIGYATGKADGKPGKATLAALRSYANDFELDMASLELTTFLAHLRGSHTDTTPRMWTVSGSECQIWAYTVPARLKVTWSGKCENGQAAGFGTARADFIVAGEASSLVYEGAMLFGKAAGWGKVSWHGRSPRSGDRYEGNFEQGLMSGRGTYFFKDGSVLRGNWRNGEASGYGVYSAEGFGRYQGAFSSSLPNGYGEHFDQSGQKRMAGVFRDGCLRNGRQWVHVIATREDCGF
ncbi:MAG: hypothetical protein Q8Q62_10940 [Mesorhizobium sp.]|nr:hypothetical protein [Mesorhizobium sp.]